MKLSAIIPAHKAEATLPRTLRSLEAAAKGLNVETVVVRDDAGRGLSWARNQGLDRATGDVVFFVDADDTVKPDYFQRLAGELEATGADFILSSFDYAPLRRDYNLTGNAAIREAMLPAFFGYSFEDVRRWNAGGSLAARREQGGVWRGAYRRDFIERHRIRFDENLRLYEDSPFIAECAARAEKVASIPDVLYEYVPGPNGILATSLGTDRYWTYKFAALENRKAIAARVGGDVLRYFAASAVFSALELLKARKGWRRYVADSFVRGAVREFPRSARHFVTAGAVTVLDAWCRIAQAESGRGE